MNKIKLLTQVLEDTEMNPEAKAYMIHLITACYHELTPKARQAERGWIQAEKLTSIRQLLRDLTNVDFDMTTFVYQTTQIQELIQRAKRLLGDV